MKLFRRRIQQPPAPSVSFARTGRVLRLTIPMGVLDASIEHLRRRGTDGHEGYLLWPGIVDPKGHAVVTTAWIPSAQTHSGFARAAQGGLIGFTRMVHDEGWALIAQVHTHPGQAFHSSIDDAHPASGRPGFISIVIPGFASQFKATAPDWRVYELRSSSWYEWGHDEIIDRIRVVRSSYD